ncbi:hypothetical protein [Peribacillus frigoritolerans]|uniref:hypothetical protein n=1 Tax=Peribacillus frigoritolerans TaxID=450367 RepID=UPI00207A9254|nr:hypothetical protein [Peribacillus frigoritolerans]USK64850.1 hypothetical protein LIT26_27735 [Peribacillus frigoritolerans]
MTRKFALLVGDGLTKDFVGNSFNTSRPFHNFDNNMVGSYYKFFMPNVKDIHDEILDLVTKHNLKNEFDAIEMFSEINKGDTRKECQLRRYLALSYSSFQRELDKQSKANWRWFNWIKTNKANLTFAISFNYDLLLETTLKECKIDNYRTGSNEKHVGVPIFKPHGSIDFDIQQPQYKNVMDQLTLSPWLWKNYFSLNQVNSMIQAIPSTHWLLPRLEADIIPPSQVNYQRHLDWVDKGFTIYNNMASEITDLIIIGHSYSVCDREEVDHFLERLAPVTKVHIVNPNISEDLTDKLESLNLEYMVITDFITMPE